MTLWQSFTFGCHTVEYEVERGDDGKGRYTGWYRWANGRMADGRWPETNGKTGEVRFRKGF